MGNWPFPVPMPYLLSVPCSTCHAEVGRDCWVVAGSTVRAVTVHRARQEAAKAAVPCEYDRGLVARQPWPCDSCPHADTMLCLEAKVAP